MKIKLIGKDKNQCFYAMSIKDDVFVHFTTQKRAQNIIKEKKLLMRPPYKKMGIDAVNAISTVYGSYVPTVADTHLKKLEEGPIVSLIFKTNIEPCYGVAEEVYWHEDVDLINPKIETHHKGIALIKESPEKIKDQDQVLYKKTEIDKIKEYFKKRDSMKLITSNIRIKAEDLYRKSDQIYWKSRLKNEYDFSIECGPEIHDSYWIIRQIYNILKSITPAIIRACGVTKLIISGTMGPNKSYFPNHGFYNPANNTITLNANIFYYPDQPNDFFDEKGYNLTRPIQTLFHEMGHALDDALGNISKKSEWMSLSGWSYTPKPGLKRLIINERGQPPVIGEMYYSPNAKFTRFYAKRNTWDDMADSFSFYMGGLKDKVPANKRTYLDSLLKNIK